MIKLLNKRWNGIAIVLLSSFFFAFVPTSAKIALDSGVSLIVLLMSRCLIGLIILAPLTYGLREPIFVDRKKVPILDICQYYFSLLNRIDLPRYRVH